MVTSDIKGIGDLLRNSNAGIAVTPEDPVELANANFNWKHTAKKTIEVFERVLT